MELMNWLCPECGLELHKHVIDIGCPVSDSGEDPIDWVGMLKAQIRRLEKRIKELESRTVLQCPHCAGLPSTATEFRRTCPKCGRQVYLRGEGSADYGEEGPGHR